MDIGSNGKLAILVGASGSGKTTLENELVKIGFDKMVSMTTRPARQGEVGNEDYYFVSDHEFDSMSNLGLLAEQTEYGGNKYGLSRKEIYDSLVFNKRNACFVSNEDGANQLANFYDEAIVFWLETDVETMIERMERRGDKPSDILNRVKHALGNNELAPQYDDWVILFKENTLEENIKIVKEVITREYGI